MRASTSEPDLCVIGASEAGRAAATGAIALGLTVTMVDDGDPSGMNNPELVIEVLRRSTEWGYSLAAAAVDPMEVWARVDRALARAAAERSHARLSAMNIRVVRGTAQFADARSVTAAGMTIRARRIFIASDSQPSGPADETSEMPRGLTLNSLRRMPRLPHHLLIVGGGHEAVSVAQALTRLGSQVTIVADSLLPGYDPELTAPLLVRLARSGVRLLEGPVSRIRHCVHTSADKQHLLPSALWREFGGEGCDDDPDAALGQPPTLSDPHPQPVSTRERGDPGATPGGVDPVAHIRQEEDGVAIVMTDGTRVDGSHVLRLDGNAPDIRAHAPDRAGIRHRDGAPALNPALRTTNPRIYVIGPAAGATSTAMARAQATVALRSAFLRQPVRFRPETVAKVTATEPRIAMIGLSEQEAATRGAVTVWRWPFAQTGPGTTSDPPGTGHLKIVANRRGRILGAGMVGDGVPESIPFWSLAVTRGLNLADLADVALPSPSWSEASRAIALSHAAGRLGTPWVKRALWVLRWLG